MAQSVNTNSGTRLLYTNKRVKSQLPALTTALQKISEHSAYANNATPAREGCATAPLELIWSEVGPADQKFHDLHEPDFFTLRPEAPMLTGFSASKKSGFQAKRGGPASKVRTTVEALSTLLKTSDNPKSYELGRRNVAVLLFKTSELRTRKTTISQRLLDFEGTDRTGPSPVDPKDNSKTARQAAEAAAVKRNYEEMLAGAGRRGNHLEQSNLGENPVSRESKWIENPTNKLWDAKIILLVCDDYFGVSATAESGDADVDEWLDERWKKNEEKRQESLQWAKRAVAKKNNTAQNRNSGRISANVDNAATSSLQSTNKPVESRKFDRQDLHVAVENSINENQLEDITYELFSTEWRLVCCRNLEEAADWLDVLADGVTKRQYNKPNKVTKKKAEQAKTSPTRSSRACTTGATEEATLLNSRIADDELSDEYDEEAEELRRRRALDVLQGVEAVDEESAGILLAAFAWEFGDLCRATRAEIDDRVRGFVGKRVVDAVWRALHSPFVVR